MCQRILEQVLLRNPGGQRQKRHQKSKNVKNQGGSWTTSKQSGAHQSMSSELIHDKNQQPNRWIEHYSDLYLEERRLDITLQLPSLPEMTELEPSIAELSKAIDDLFSGKAPGNDAIPAERLKMNKLVILPDLQQILIYCWRVSVVPHDIRNATIITLHKNKGGKGDCNNYRGICLLSLAGKAFARVS